MWKSYEIQIYTKFLNYVAPDLIILEIASIFLTRRASLHAVITFAFGFPTVSKQMTIDIDID